MKYPEMEEAHGKGCSGVAVKTRRWRAEAAEGFDGSPKKDRRRPHGEVLLGRSAHGQGLHEGLWCAALGGGLAQGWSWWGCAHEANQEGNSVAACLLSGLPRGET